MTTKSSSSSSPSLSSSPSRVKSLLVGARARLKSGARIEMQEADWKAIVAEAEPGERGVLLNAYNSGRIVVR